MGKKSINEVLAHGKALQKAVKESREKGESAGSAEDPEYPVPLNSKLPGGLTLKGFMKKQGVSYEEACRIYHAYQDHAAEEEDKLEKRRGVAAAKAKAKTKAKSNAEATPDATPEPAEPEPVESTEESKSNPKKNSSKKMAQREVAAPEPRKADKKKKAEATETAEDPPKKRSKAKAAEEASEPTEPAEKAPKKRSKAKAAEEASEHVEPAEKNSKKRSKAKAAEEASASPVEPKPAAKSCKRELSFASAFSSEEEHEPDATPEGEPDLDGEPLEDGDVEAASKYTSPKKFRRVHEKRALTLSETKAIGKGMNDDKGGEPLKMLEDQEPTADNSKVKRKNADVFATPESAKHDPPMPRSWCLDYFNTTTVCVVFVFFLGSNKPMSAFVN